MKEYLNNEENKKDTISITHKYNNIVNIFYGVNNQIRFIVSEIKIENQLKTVITVINEMKNKNGNNNKKILIQFEQLNGPQIQFISNFTIKHSREDSYK